MSNLNRLKARKLISDTEVRARSKGEVRRTALDQRGTA
jgi:hypothetical protein